MNKLKYLLLGAAGLLMASCSTEDIPAGAGEDGNVAITISLPTDMATRALYGEGETSKQLQYAVFTTGTEGTSTLVISSSQEMGTALTTTLKLNLLAGKEYEIVLFAESDAAASGSVYTFDPEKQTITVNYDKMQSAENNADAYDCFFGTVPTGKLGSGTSSFNVEMTRPMAQLNWGTNDLNANAQMNTNFAEGRYIQTTLTVENPPTALNMLTGEVTTSEKPVTLPALTVPGAFEGNSFGFDFPVSGYQYLAMQYVLAPSKSTLTEVTLNIKNGFNSGPNNFTKNITLTDFPLQANYRTNVYGTLLSSNADVNITVSPDWSGSDDVNAPWDGTTVTTPATSGNYTFIQKPSDLAGLAKQINDGDDFSGKSILLVNDLDMGGHALSLGVVTRNGGTYTGNGFRGVFDGNNKTISNLTISETGVEDEAIGFIPSVAGADASVRNIIFDKIEINAPRADQAGVVGLVSEGATVSGITINSGSVVSYEGCGAIVGRILASGTVENCNNYATVTSNHYQAGGIVGAAYRPEPGQTMTIRNCNNYGSIVCNSDIHDWGMQPAGGIVAYSFANVVDCANYGSVESTVSITGGIVGWQDTQGSISGCTNEGSVTGGCLVGGIAGLIATGTDKSITVSGNTNKGNVTGSGRYESQDGCVGGIIGSCGSPIVCINNTNEAAWLHGNGPASSGNYVAGIIGQANMSQSATAIPYVLNNTNNTPLESMTGNPVNALYNGYTRTYEEN